MPTATPAAPTRRDRKKARTRDDIFRTAVRLFGERGADGVTVEQICDAADVARATFFLHFPTKDAVLTEWARQALHQITETLRSHRGSAVDGLRLALGGLADRVVANAGMVQVIVREIMARPAAMAANTEQSRGLVDLLAILVRRGQARGELRRGVDPRLAAGIVSVAYLAIVGEWARDPKSVDLRRGVELALDVVLHGLVPKRT